MKGIKTLGLALVLFVVGLAPSVYARQKASYAIVFGNCQNYTFSGTGPMTVGNVTQMAVSLEKQ